MRSYDGIQPRMKGCISANALKVIAVIAMVIDHLTYVIPIQQTALYIVMRFIGRLAAPIMFYFAVEAYHHTHSVNKYIGRLSIFALISYIPYIYFMENTLPNMSTWYRFNVIYSILIGVLFIHVKHEVKNVVLKVLVMALLVYLSILGDWSYRGLLMMCVFDFFYRDYEKQRFAYLLVVFTAGNLITYFFENPVLISLTGMPFDTSIYELLLSEWGRIVPIVLLRGYNGKLGKGGRWAKWGFYIFYPAHLLLLALARNIFV